FRDHAGTLKYEFHVRPGARLSEIQLAYEGTLGLATDASGGLLIQTPRGTLRDAAPVAYQQIGGVRVPVKSRYVLAGDGSARTSYGFAVEGYDSSRELIVDPGVDYSTFLGGNIDVDTGTGIAVDAAGNAYVVGYTQSSDFPTTAGAFRRSGAVLAFT